MQVHFFLNLKLLENQSFNNSTEWQSYAIQTILLFKYLDEALFVSFLAVKDSGDEGSSSARTIGRQHQIEFVIDSHQLRYPRPHNVWEMRVISENRAVDGDYDVVVVHLFQQSRDAR